MSGHCQVDFYVLQSADQSARHLACRLALMAWEQGHRVTVLTENEKESRLLDELMWQSPAGRFLPHAVGRTDPDAPVLIESMPRAVSVETDVIINLTATEFPEPNRYKRLLEIVPANDTERTASRHKFRAYRGLGLQPVSHSIGKSK